MQDFQVSLLWISMIVLTLLSFAMAVVGYQGTFFVGFVLVTGFIKGQIIIDHFMQLKSARLLWRLIVSIWLITVLAVIGLLYFTT